MTYVACVQKTRAVRFYRYHAKSRAAARGGARPGAMALCALNDDALGIISYGLCNPLEPRVAVAFSSASRGLRALTHALRQQLRADHDVAAALCHRMGTRSCKELREAKELQWEGNGLCAADLTTLGTLVSVLPHLEHLRLRESRPVTLASALPLLEHLDLRESSDDGVPELMAKVGVGTLPALTDLALSVMHVGDPGASALGAALGRGALPRLRTLELLDAAIGSAGLVALAPALRKLPALEVLALAFNPLGDEGIAALVAPPPPAGALSPPAAGLTKLIVLILDGTLIADAGCAALISALDSGALPALEYLMVGNSPASPAAVDAVRAALARARDTAPS